MTTEIKNKWKRFAVEQMTSNFNPSFTAEHIFDALVYSEDHEIPELLLKYDVIIWAPFENMTVTDFAYKLEELARAAAECEEYNP